MTDYLGRFGEVRSNGSDNTIDFGEIDSRAAMQSHRTGEQHEATVVFNADSDQNTVCPCMLIHSDSPDAGFSLLSQLNAEPPKAGNFAFMPMPKSHKRYVQAASDGRSGVTAFLEPGPGQGRY